MKISVVLPVRNGAATIKRAVVSILNQTFEEFEVLIIDDGSTDNTWSLIQSIAGRDARIKLFSLPKQGIARALNFGIKMSSGKYIARMDADDYSYPQRLDKQYNYLEDHPEIGLVSCLVNFNGNTETGQGYAIYVDWINILTNDTQFRLKRFQESPFAHPSVCFRRSLIRQYGGYHEGPFPEDYELWLRWMHQGVAMHKLKDTLLEWHDNPHRLSRSHTNYNDNCFYRIKAIYLKKYLRTLYPVQWPPLLVWGAGRAVNHRVKHLIAEGLVIAKYIDVKHHKNNDHLIHYSELPAAGKAFILSYVSDRKGKIEIIDFLINNGYKEGTNFLMMA